jgi:predicted transposase/invertase (TIGR01784 family)
MGKKILSAKLDFIFKLIFGDDRHTDILASFLMSVLRLPFELFQSLVIIDPHFPQEFEDDKLGILDVKLRLTSGKVIDIEIQVKYLPHLEERIVFYTSKMVTEQIRSGNEYGIIKPVVTILITDFVMYKQDYNYHHHFEMYDCENNVLFSDLMGIHVLELPKLPTMDDNTELWQWLTFINSDDEEELQMLSERNPVIGKAYGIRMELSQDEKIRLLAESREKARRDQADMLWGAKHEGASELTTILKQLGVPPDILSKANAIREGSDSM